MPDIIAPLEMGFAEFVAKLIAEVFDAVADSQAEQALRQAEIVATAALTPEAFAEQLLSEEQVDAELARLFPTSEPNRPHAIFPGAVYRAKEHHIPESPAIESVLGLELGREDYLRGRAGETVLQPSAVDKVKRQTRLRLAHARLLALRQLVKQGIPRVLVDSGRVNAKMTFQAVRTEDASKPEIAGRLAAPLNPLGQIAGTPLPRSLANIRLVVRPADAQSPQTSQLQLNIFGEVEVTFKTVT
jgi:hypothetical protein